MATAGDVVKTALLDILVETDEGSIEASDYADAFTALNRYMATLAVRGIKLGYTNVSNNADEVTVPDGAVEGIAANLAVRLAPSYGVAVSGELLGKAKEGEKVMRMIGQHVPRAAKPANLPIGSGSYRYTYKVSAFMGHVHQGLLSLNGNTSATTLAAINTPVKVSGFWNVERLEGIEGDITGRFTSNADTDINVQLKLSGSATGNGGYTFRLMQNGVSMASVAATLSSSPTDFTLAKILTLSPGEYVEVWVEGDSTNAVTVTGAQLELV